MKQLSIILIIIALASCSHQGAMLSNTKQELGLDSCDSNAWRIAVLPTLQCLPIYYAEKAGWMNAPEVNMQLLRYNAQMDVDTALQKKHAHIAMSDLIRAIQLCEKGRPVVSFWTINEPMSLVVLKDKRVNKVRQMKEKMIAISRLSISDYWCDKMIDTSEVSHQAFYRPQINDIILRTDMLRTGLIDASILPQPYTEWMKAEGHTILKSTSENDLHFGAWIAQLEIASDPLQHNKLKQFIELYKKATRHINEKKDVQTVKHILIEEYKLPPALLDSLEIPQISEGRTTLTKEVGEAKKWLKERNQLQENFSTDSLIFYP